MSDILWAVATYTVIIIFVIITNNYIERVDTRLCQIEVMHNISTPHCDEMISRIE